MSNNQSVSTPSSVVSRVPSLTVALCNGSLQRVCAVLGEKYGFNALEAEAYAAYALKKVVKEKVVKEKVVKEKVVKEKVVKEKVVKEKVVKEKKVLKEKDSRGRPKNGELVIVDETKDLFEQLVLEESKAFGVATVKEVKEVKVEELIVVDTESKKAVKEVCKKEAKALEAESKKAAKALEAETKKAAKALEAESKKALKKESKKESPLEVIAAVPVPSLLESVVAVVEVEVVPVVVELEPNNAAKEETKKAGKALEAESKKALKALEAESKKALKAQEQESKKALKALEAESKKVAKAETKKEPKKKVEKVVVELPVAIQAVEVEVEVEVEEEINVKSVMHKGVEYLKSSDGVMYDKTTQEPVGTWNASEQCIDELEEEEYEEEDADEN